MELRDLPLDCTFRRFETHDNPATEDNRSQLSICLLVHAEKIAAISIVTSVGKGDFTRQH